MRYIDSHTEGEPTRVLLEGGPDLGVGSLAERAKRFAKEADACRTSVILEPRGSDAVVGAFLCKPVDTSCATGVIFFNNRGYLGMCGHGAMGVAVTLAYLGRIDIGTHRIETPVGVVDVNLLNPNEVALENVPSYQYRAGVQVEVEGMGRVTGSIAWGGNWFFLLDHAPAPLRLENARPLTVAAENVMKALREQGITGEDGSEIDHIEFFGPPESGHAHSRNFVLCPGGAYDRSPCGTGTSAKLACLAVAGALRPGAEWVQESLIGSRFIASYQPLEAGRILPTIRGRAFVCGEGTLIQHADDPYRYGIL
jgi:4-hydroxyproline epimerase